MQEATQKNLKLKNPILTCLLLLSLGVAKAQSYWQQQLHYFIDVSLNDQDKSLNGFLKLTYKNQSPDTLNFIWFHLWPNAYKNDRTAFSEQMLRSGRTDFYFSNKDKRGYINQLDFRSNNQTLKVADHPLYIDVVKVLLNEPLLPGASVQITTPFHVKLPAGFSRNGYKDETFAIAQWYPKPAVYDSKGWHPMPYLELGEYYSEFADYDVKISLPKNYVVAATGLLQNEEEKAWLNARAQFKMPAPTLVRKKPGAPAVKMVVIPSAKESKTLEYKQTQVHDFAWFASKKWVVQSDTCMLQSKEVVVSSFYEPSEAEGWNSSVELMKNSLRKHSELIGEYPYQVVSAVSIPFGEEGGMEYPTITSIRTDRPKTDLNELLIHETGHNWFQSALASNERDYPWLDEGLNSYFDHLILNESKKAGTSRTDFEKLILNYTSLIGRSQPINTVTDSLTPFNYLVLSYSKTSLWLQSIEAKMGKEKLMEVFKEYFQKWQHKHPQPEDFLRILEAKGGPTVAASWSYLNGTAAPDSISTHRPLKFGLFKNINNLPRYNIWSASPAFGFNNYDGVQLGLLLHNYNPLPTKFNWLIAPLYGLKSKSLNGAVRLSYTNYEGSGNKKIWSLSGMKFSTNSGVDSLNNAISSNVIRIVPGFKWYFGNSLNKETREQWIEFKAFILGNTGFKYVLRKSDTTYHPELTKRSFTSIQQLTYSLSDSRALYPYDLKLQVQQGKDFYRLNATGNYFFNYKKYGGMNVRVFAAGFGFIGKRTSTKAFNTLAFQPKLTAVRGYEDYTYSNYFFGREETTGFASQQIMMRDGGLKLRTDLFQGLQGRSEKWIASINFTTSLPPALIPKFIPLKLFLDAGTYAEAWDKNNNTTRFLYVGGLQLSLFKGAINVYAPLVYSKLFSDNLKSVPEENKFLKKLSFSIDIQHWTLKKFLGKSLPL